MFDAARESHSQQPVDEMSAGDLLTAARAAQATAWLAEADVLACALQWAVTHPSRTGNQNDEDAATFWSPTGDSLPVAGEGCPGIEEFSIAEFGAVLGISTPAAKRMIGHALELAHRLPRCWARVKAGEVPPWRARLVAEATIHADPALTDVAAAWLDAQLAPFLEKLTTAQLERTLSKTLILFGLAATTDPDDPDSPDHGSGAGHVTFDKRQVGHDGSIDLHATLDAADALDLENAVRAGAVELKELGSEEPLDVRRAAALGHMARHQLALDLTGSRTKELPTHGSAARRLDLHLHFDASMSPDGVLGVSPLGFLENGQRQVLLEQVKAWARGTHTDVRITPVIDLNTERESSGYTPPSTLRSQIQLRDRTCTFPWCTRPARRTDIDHTERFDADHQRDINEARQATPATAPLSQTRTSNLGALCRHHHRLKTHTAWHVEQPTSGTFIWTSPHGRQYRRDHTGTVPLAPPSGAPPPRPPRRMPRATAPSVPAQRQQRL